MLEGWYIFHLKGGIFSSIAPSGVQERTLIQAGAELGQAQLKLGLDFSVDLWFNRFGFQFLVWVSRFGLYD